MPVSVRFALRSTKNKKPYSNPHPLEVWITVNGQRAHFGAVWPVQTGTKLVVDPSEWKVKQQRSTRRDDPVTKKVTALKAHIEEIFDKQCLVAVPTIKSIVYELSEQKPPQYDQKTGWVLSPLVEPVNTNPALTEETSLLQAYMTRIIEIRLDAGPKPTRTQEINIGRWERGLFLLEEWSRQRGKEVPACYRITLSWLNDYHAWLQKQTGGKQKKPISPGQASRYIGKIGKILQWLVNDELLTHNSVKKRTWPRYNDKEILFLEPEQIRHLFTLDWDGTKGEALWWFLLMCCTGLDYPDAVVYAANRASLERTGIAGAKLVGKRLKPPHESFDVPLLDEVDLLFTRKPTGADDISSACVNRHTEHIEDELGVNWRITIKIARKTFGCLMLISGYYIGEVSRMLGHKRISTTESHYVKIIGSAVDRGRQRVNKTNLL